MTRIAPEWLTDRATRRVMAAMAQAKPLFVGGCVRDALMGRSTQDIDIAVLSPPERTLELAANAGLKAVPTGLAHGVVTVVSDGRPFEIATLRRDVATDGRRAVVAYSTELSEDAARRDFTMNALYATATGEVIDPLGGGVDDLRARRLCFIGDPCDRIREDFLRILRFFRFHAQFAIEPVDQAGLDACLRETAGLELISKERIGAELSKLLAAADPGPAIAAMGPILTAILPGAQPLGGLVAAEAALGLDADPLRRLAQVAPDPGAARAALRLSNADVARLKAVAKALGEPRLRVAAYTCGAAAAADAAALRLAAGGAAPGPNWRQEVDRGASARFPVTARDLAARGVTPGPAIGAALKEMEARWLEGEMRLSREALLEGLSDA